MLLSSLEVAAEYNVQFYVNGELLTTMTTIDNYFPTTQMPLPHLNNDSVYFLGWTDSPMPETMYGDETSVSYFDLSKQLLSDIVLYAVFAVTEPDDNEGFAPLTDASQLVPAYLYVFTDFNDINSDSKHVMSVNSSDNLGLKASREPVLFTDDGQLVPGSDVFVGRMLFINNFYRFIRHHTTQSLAMNSKNRTYQQVCFANPLPERWTSEGRTFSAFTINVSSSGKVNMALDEKPSSHIAYGQLTRGGYTAEVFHNMSNTSSPVSQKPLYLYYKPQNVKRITLFPLDPPLVQALNVTQDFVLEVRDGMICVDLKRMTNIVLYDLQGRLLSKEKLTAGHHTLTIPQGVKVIIAYVGHQVRKIVL